MAKVKEEIPSIIPEAERIEEIEKEVRFHVARIGKPYTIVTKKQVRTVPPKFKDSAEEKNWQMNEIRKCIEGDGIMSGKMYFWYNYCWLRDPERGKIRPDFRVIDLEWFKILEECQASKEWGVVSVKRRRIGASWRAGLQCQLRPCRGSDLQCNHRTGWCWRCLKWLESRSKRR